MTRLYLVRHGTHDLVGRVLAGRSPGLHLSVAGRAQADAVAAFLSTMTDIGTVLSSPLERCLETAAPIAARLGLAVAQANALAEIDCGDWTGSAFAALATDPCWQLWNTRRSGAVVPGGESAQAVQQRAMSLVRSLNTADPAAAVLVTHADVIKSIVLAVLDASLDGHDRLEIEPASITVVDLWDGGGRIVRSNQVVT